MTYEEELRAKLDAVRPLSPTNQRKTLDLESREAALFEELEHAFEFAQYDLDEQDLLRTLKVMHILQGYGDAFGHQEALRLFFIVAQVEVVMPKRLLEFMQLDVTSFKGIVNAMARQQLLFINDDEELELTLGGKSLASRIGLNLYV